MFTLGIPNSQQRRANSVLTHDRSTPVEYEVHKQDKDFHIFTFIDIDYDGFYDIVLLLKKNGISTIGADEQLTERNIMKLTNLIKEQHKPQNPPQYNTDSDTPSQGFEKEEKSVDTIINM